MNTSLPYGPRPTYPTPIGLYTGRVPPLAALTRGGVELSTMPSDRIPTPESKLWLAVIMQACQDYLGPPCAVQAEADAWFHSSSEDFGSFRFATGVIDVDPAYVLRLFKERMQTRPAAFKRPRTTTAGRGAHVNGRPGHVGQWR